MNPRLIINMKQMITFVDKQINIKKWKYIDLNKAQFT